MNIIFVCPKCGHDLESGQLVSDPPIPTMRCQKCGFQWAGRLDFEEGELRVPLSPPQRMTGMHPVNLCRNAVASAITTQIMEDRGCASVHSRISPEKE